MKTFKEFLAESPQIGLAKTAYKSLSHDAKNAIDQWETSGWIGGALEKHFVANDHIAQEIEAAFAPIRHALPKMVKLYRGMQADTGHSDSYKTRHLESWTDDKKVAEHFAGLRTPEHTDKGVTWHSNLYDEFTEDEIAKAVETFNKHGFVTFKGKRYMRNKDDPQYYNIYDRHRLYVADGDNIAADLRSHSRSIKEINKDKKDQAILVEKMISRDKIVWITNNTHSKEYIVHIR